MYFSINLQPKKLHSVCEDLFDRILIFDEPAIYNRNRDNFDVSSKLDGDWKIHIGSSHNSDPVKISYLIDNDDVEDSDNENEADEEIVVKKQLPSRSKRASISYDEDSDSVFDVDQESEDDDEKPVKKTPQKKSSPSTKIKSKKSQNTSPKATNKKEIPSRKRKSISYAESKEDQGEDEDEDESIVTNFDDDDDDEDYEDEMPSAKKKKSKK
jgi:hypothetical protein